MFFPLSTNEVISTNKLVNPQIRNADGLSDITTHILVMLVTTMLSYWWRNICSIQWYLG